MKIPAPYRCFLLSLAGLALLALPAARPLAAKTVDTVDESFNVRPGGQLTVDVRHGRIEVNTSPAAQVAVHIVREIRAGSKSREEDLLREENLEISATDNDVTITANGTKDDGWSLWSFLRGRNTKHNHRYTITVPTEFNVDLKTSGGRIDVTGVEGTIVTKTSGGGLQFADINGEIDGRTSGGGITLEHCFGPVSVHTSGGGIKARDGAGELRLDTSGGGISVSNHRGDVVAETSGGGITTEQIHGRLDAETSGGPIRASFQSAPEADCRLHTSGGGITVALPEDAAFDLDASTSGGSVRCDFPVTVSGEIKRNRLSGPVNGGGPTLLLRTSGGGIRVSTL